MEIILTHEQADFDAAGSVLAAWLLDPSRIPVLPKRRNRNLAAFVEDYKSRLPFFTWQTLPKGSISRIYITDTQMVALHSRMEGVKDVVIWDHHPHRHIFPDRDENIYDPTGACTTFLVEKLMLKKDLHPGRIFATLMLMGIYEDTGSLSYGSTTPRDIRAAAWLVEKGADLDLMRRYVLQPMTDHQQLGFDRLMQSLETYDILGKNIVIACADIREISDEFSAVAHHIRDMLNPDGLVLLLAVKTGVRIICRATTDEIDFGGMMRNFNGGGHTRAASGTMPIDYMETANVDDVLSDARESILEALPGYVTAAKTDLSEKLDTQMTADQLRLIRRVAEAAEQLGMPVYIVGGVVRDLLQNNEIMDFDIVVEGDATRLGKQVTACYGGKLTVHPQFFTAKWQLPDGASLDLISARSEHYAAPGALPDVEMAGIEQDLKRRDFTLNTLAVRLDGEHYGELLDLCGGLHDLENHLIRTLHDRSFLDDPTRIFRAVRFEQRFCFELENDTLRQLREQLGGISGLTGQRIWHELKLFCDETYPEKDFARIAELGAAAQIHEKLVWNRKIELDCKRMLDTDPEPYWLLRDGIDQNLVRDEAVLWCWLSALPMQTIAELGERLALPNKTLRCIEGLAKLREEFPKRTACSPSEVTFFLEALPAESLLCYSLICPKSEKKLLKKYVTVWSRIHPAATGEDLRSMGIKPGPEYREILTGLRAECIDANLQPEEEEAWIEHFVKDGAGKHGE